MPVRTESQIYAAIAANETLITALRSAVAHTLAVEVVDHRTTKRMESQCPTCGDTEVVLAR